MCATSTIKQLLQKQAREPELARESERVQLVASDSPTLYPHPSIRGQNTLEARFIGRGHGSTEVGWVIKLQAGLSVKGQRQGGPT